MSYDGDLATCARRGDGWMFHQLLNKALRHALVAWFSVERRHCPHPCWFGQWVARFGMDPAIAALERGLWAPPVSLARRRELFLAMCQRILATFEPSDRPRSPDSPGPPGSIVAPGARRPR